MLCQYAQILIYTYIYNIIHLEIDLYNYDISDYEILRNANIARNNEELRMMGLDKRVKGHTHEVPKQSSGGQSTNIVLLYYLDNSIVNL